jgi:hypothetical protein
VLERGLSNGSERILAAVNADGEPFTAYFDAGAGSGLDLLSGKEIDLSGGLFMPPFSSFLLRV